MRVGGTYVRIRGLKGPTETVYLRTADWERPAHDIVNRPETAMRSTSGAARKGMLNAEKLTSEGAILLVINAPKDENVMNAGRRLRPSIGVFARSNTKRATGQSPTQKAQSSDPHPCLTAHAAGFVDLPSETNVNDGVDALKGIRAHRLKADDEQVLKCANLCDDGSVVDRLYSEDQYQFLVP